MKHSGNRDGNSSTRHTYGFDQITKVSDNSGGGSGSSSGTSSAGQTAEQSALVQKLTSWIQELKAAFVAGDWAGLGRIVGDGVNSAVAAISAVDIGTTAGMFANNLVTTLHSTLTTINFSAIGTTAGKMLTAAMEQVDWKKTGEVVGKGLVMLPSITVGFILGTDWSVVGQSVSQCISGVLQSVTEWIRGVDWLQLGQCAATLIANINWSQLSVDLFTFFGTALGAGVSVLWGFIGNAVESIKEYFTGKIQECGGNVALGLLKGILDGLANIGTWIWNNIFVPVWDGIRGAFGIHSPSTKMAEIGGYLIAGLLGGIINSLGNIVNWVGQNIVTPFVNAFDSIKIGGVGAFTLLWNGIKSVINSITGGVESMVNWVIKGINGLIGAFNKVASVGSYFGLDLQISKINTVSLPRLAKGTVVDEPTAAIIGEAGKEAVMPLENNTGWITDLAHKINQQGGNQVTSLSLAIYFRSRKLAECVIQDINQITKEKGVCPIII